MSGHFNKAVTGPQPQNTGIQGLDGHIDRTIGQSSAQGWDVAEQRKRAKEAVMHDYGVTGKDLGKNPDGSYGVIGRDRRAIHERSQKIHQAAGEWRHKNKKTVAK